MSDELEHSSRGPSGAHRWRRCKGSIAAEEGLPDKVRFVTAEGSVFHEYASMCLEHELEPESFPLGVIKEQDGWKVEYTKEMRADLHEGLEWVRGLLEPGDILIVEKKVDISPWAGPDQFGSCDCAIIKVRQRKIIIFDWKYGGDPVHPEKNDQCYLYALGVWNDYAEAIFGDPKDVEVLFKIEQPRAPGGGGEWETTMEEILAEGVLIREDALETMNPNAVRTPGEKQCKFCKASGRCPEEQAYHLDIFQMTYEEIADDIEFGLKPALVPPEKLSAEVRAYIYLHRTQFAKYIKRLREIMVHDLRMGLEVPLVKLIEGRAGIRAYKPGTEDKVKFLLSMNIPEDKVVKEVIISPAEAEKLMGKKKFKELVGEYIFQPEGKPSLVSIDHKKPALENVTDLYEDLEDEDEGEFDVD